MPIERPGAGFTPRLAKALTLTALFFLYVALSIGCFGLTVVVHPSHVYVGHATDPSISMWFIAWWPNALSRRLNPFFTTALWAPSGFNVTRTTSIPLLSLLVWPITYLWGPVVAYNCLALLAPALDAFAAFLLCTLVTGELFSSFVGGLIFGFSPYVYGQAFGHLHMTFVAWVPLAVYLSILRMRGSLGRASFITLLTALLSAEFLTSLEVFATMTLVSAFLLGLWIMAEYWDHGCRRAVSVSREIVAAYILTGVVVSPILYYFFAYPEGPWLPDPTALATSVRAFFVPSPNIFISHHQYVALTHHHFGDPSVVLHGDFGEAATYLGPPVLLLIVLFARNYRGRLKGRLLLGTMLFSYALSFGPYKKIFGRAVPLPWCFLWKLPLFNEVIPARLALYTYLAAAVIVASYLAAIASLRSRIAIGLLCILFIFPDVPYASFSASTVDTPRFFTEGLYKEILQRGDIVLILPFGWMGNSMLWQASSGFYFRMAGGYTGPEPVEFASWDDNRLFADGLGPENAGVLRAYITANRVRAVIVADTIRSEWNGLSSVLSSQPAELGGVTFYRVPPTRHHTR
jgi:hypothetical protein